MIHHEHIPSIVTLDMRCGLSTKPAKAKLGPLSCPWKIKFTLGREKNKVREVWRALPAGCAGLVNQRSNLWGLKYPSLDLYTIFFFVEKGYSLLTTTSNFMNFGSILLEKTCHAILKNPTYDCLSFCEAFWWQISQGPDFSRHKILHASLWQIPR